MESPSGEVAVMAPLVAVSCFVCSSLLPSRISEHLTRRLMSMLETDVLLEAIYLCGGCNLKMLQIEQLIAELRKLHKDKGTKVITKNEHGASPIPASGERSIKEEQAEVIPVTAVPASSGDASDNEDTAYDDADAADGDMVKRQKLDCGCGATFATQQTLEIHQRDNHGGGVVCRHCGLALTDPAQIMQHSSVHSLDSGKCTELKCGCGAADFATATELRMHRDAAHAGRFVCEVCKKTYHSNSHLLRHYQQMHARASAKKPTPIRKSLRERKATAIAIASKMEDEDEKPLTSRQKAVRKTREAAISAKRADELKNAQIDAIADDQLKAMEVSGLNRPVEHPKSWHPARLSEAHSSHLPPASMRGVRVWCGDDDDDAETHECHQVDKYEAGLVVKCEDGLATECEGHVWEKSQDSVMETCEEGFAMKSEYMVEKCENCFMTQCKGNAMENCDSTMMEKCKGCVAEKCGDGCRTNCDRSVVKCKDCIATKCKACVMDKSEGSVVEKCDGSVVERCDGIVVEKHKIGLTEKYKDGFIENHKDNIAGFLQHPCPTCDLIYRSLKYLTKHITKYHWDVSNGKYMCQFSGCSQVFPGQDEVAVHARKHRAMMWGCTSCEMVFPHRNRLTEHKLHEHTKAAGVTELPHGQPAPEVCAYCEKSFNTKSQLSHHTLVTHQKALVIGNKNKQDIFHICPHCQESFKVLHNLNKHLAQHAKQVGSKAPAQLHKCIVCHQRFQIKKGHLDDDQTCRGCMAGQIAKTEKLRHLCNVCGATYVDKGSFQLHLANHSETGKLQCERCQKQFVRRHQLKVHMEQHTRPHMCSQCERCFSTLAHMQEHQVIHSSKLSFACPKCPQQFRWQLSLVRHMWRVHQEGTPPKVMNHMVICSLCNQVLRTGSRARHFRRNHPDEVYSISYFTRNWDQQGDVAAITPTPNPNPSPLKIEPQCGTTNTSSTKLPESHTDTIVSVSTPSTQYLILQPPEVLVASQPEVASPSGENENYQVTKEAESAVWLETQQQWQ